MVTEIILVEKCAPLGVIRLNHADNLNALSPDLLARLDRELKRCADDSDIRVILLTGQGRAFSSGADIRFMAKASPQQCRRYLQQGQAVLNYLESMNEPVLAVINGICTGGGCALAGACDLSIAASSATFGEPEAGIGLPGGFGNAERFSRRVGRAAAAELMLTGRLIDAGEAYRLGLVSRVVPDDRLWEEAEKLAKGIAENAPTALAEIKKLLRAIGEQPPHEARAVEIDAFLTCLTEGEGREGMRAFLEKRKGNWND